MDNNTDNAIKKPYFDKGQNAFIGLESTPDSGGLLTDEYREAVYFAELDSPTKGKKVFDALVAKTASIKEAECQQEKEKA